MTIFASKTPRDLNRDAFPWAYTSPESGARIHVTAGLGRWMQEHGTTDAAPDPRPEFDPPKAHNEPNPILLAFRDHVAWRWVYLPVVATYAEDAETFLAGLDADPILDTTPAHHEHARRVLARLSNAARR